MRNALHRLAIQAERLIDRLKPRRTGPLFLDPYLGYATREHVILRGRVLKLRKRPERRAHGTTFHNIRDMLDRFRTDEVSDVEVRHGIYAAHTDEEGYFTLQLPREDQVGLQSYTLTLDGDVSAHCEALIPRDDAPAIVISDIDDTMMYTGAHSLPGNLWTTFTGAVDTREVFPDALSLMTLFSETLELPIYFVSSSPWNLHAFLLAVFERAGLPKAPMFLRDFGIDEGKFIMDGHGNHKGDSIDLVLAAHGGTPAVLVGDTGQEDARIFRAAVERHPGRIAAVVLRMTRNGLDPKNENAVAMLKASGVPTFVGDVFTPFESDLHALLTTQKQ